MKLRPIYTKEVNITEKNNATESKNELINDIFARTLNQAKKQLECCKNAYSNTNQQSKI